MRQRLRGLYRCFDVVAQMLRGEPMERQVSILNEELSPVHPFSFYFLIPKQALFCAVGIRSRRIPYRLLRPILHRASLPVLATVLPELPTVEPQ